MRIGLGHAPHICLNGPSYLMPRSHQRVFLDQYYFKRYFGKSYRFLFYLILRNILNIFWPGLSPKTENDSFVGNGKQLENLEVIFREKDPYPLFWCHKPPISWFYYSVNSYFWQVVLSNFGETEIWHKTHIYVGLFALKCCKIEFFPQIMANVVEMHHQFPTNGDYIFFRQSRTIYLRILS